MSETLDSLDRRLLALLRSDARLPTAQLAERLHVSRGTVQNRMTRLERSGVISGYTVRLRNDGDDDGVHAITMIEVHGAATDSVIAGLRRIPESVHVHSTNGRWDLVAQFHATDLNAFDRVLRELRAIEGVTNSESHLLLAAYK